MYSVEQNQKQGDRQTHSFRHPHFKSTEPTLQSLQMECGARIILLALQSNQRGNFIRVVVEENDWYNAIIVPLFAADEFRQCVDSVTRGGAVTKGMVESEGRTIFVRLEHNDLLLGERSEKRNISVIIPQPAIGDFKRMLDELLETAATAAKRPNRRPQKPRLDEKTLYSRKLPAGAKTVQLMVKENSLGRFLRLVEGDGFRFTSVIIPAEQLDEFRNMLDEAICVSRQTPEVVKKAVVRKVDSPSAIR